MGKKYDIMYRLEKCLYQNTGIGSCAIPHGGQRILEKLGAEWFGEAAICFARCKINQEAYQSYFHWFLVKSIKKTDVTMVSGLDVLPPNKRDIQDTNLILKSIDKVQLGQLEFCES